MPGILLTQAQVCAIFSKVRPRLRRAIALHSLYRLKLGAHGLRGMASNKAVGPNSFTRRLTLGCSQPIPFIRASYGYTRPYPM